MPRYACMLTVILTVIVTAPAHAQSSVKVNIDALRTDRGKACAAIWQNKEGFLKDGESNLVCTDIHAGRATVTFDNLKPGEYAVSVFHDENGNGKLDTNLLGIPREGTGFSNNAKGHPPSFDAAKFNPGDNGVVLSVMIRY